MEYMELNSSCADSEASLRLEAKSEGDTWAVRIGGSEFRADGFELSLDGDNQAWISFAELVELRHHLG